MVESKQGEVELTGTSTRQAVGNQTKPKPGRIGDHVSLGPKAVSGAPSPLAACPEAAPTAVWLYRRDHTCGPKICTLTQHCFLLKTLEKQQAQQGTWPRHGFLGASSAAPYESRERSSESRPRDLSQQTGSQPRLPPAAHLLPFLPTGCCVPPRVHTPTPTPSGALSSCDGYVHT